VQQVANQGDVSGDNFGAAPTDDPALPGAADPTAIAVAAALVLLVPTLSRWALFGLLLALAALGWRRIGGH
jgi:hypothetical protein